MKIDESHDVLPWLVMYVAMLIDIAAWAKMARQPAKGEGSRNPIEICKSLEKTFVTSSQDQLERTSLMNDGEMKCTWVRL